MRLVEENLLSAHEEKRNNGRNYMKEASESVYVHMYLVYLRRMIIYDHLFGTGANEIRGLLTENG